MKRKLRLFVWENVLCAWSCGIMFALAYDVEEARQEILKNTPCIDNVELLTEPKIYDTPIGYAIYGGG